MNTEFQKQGQESLPPVMTPPRGQDIGWASELKEQREEKRLGVGMVSLDEMSKAADLQLKRMSDEAKEKILSLDEIAESAGIGLDTSLPSIKADQRAAFVLPEASQISDAEVVTVVSRDARSVAEDIEKRYGIRFNLDGTPRDVNMFGVMVKAQAKLQERHQIDAEYNKLLDQLRSSYEENIMSIPDLMAKAKREYNISLEPDGTMPKGFLGGNQRKYNKLEASDRQSFDAVWNQIQNALARGKMPERKQQSALGKFARTAGLAGVVAGAAGGAGAELKRVDFETKTTASGARVEQELAKTAFPKGSTIDKTVEFAKKPIGYEKMEGKRISIESRNAPFVMEPGSPLDPRLEEALEAGQPIRTPFGEIAVVDVAGETYVFVKDNDRLVRAAVFKGGVATGEVTYDNSGRAFRKKGKTDGIQIARATTRDGALVFGKDFLEKISLEEITATAAAPTPSADKGRSKTGSYQIAGLSSKTLKLTPTPSVSSAFEDLQPSTGLYNALPEVGVRKGGSMLTLEQYKQQQKDRIAKELKQEREKKAANE